MSARLQPETRTRVLFDQTAKEGWRVKEITIELEGHPAPVDRTSELFHQMRRQAEHDAAIANADSSAGQRIRLNGQPTN